MQTIAWSCGRTLWRQYESFKKAFNIANLKLIDDTILKALARIILLTVKKFAPNRVRTGGLSRVKGM